MCACVCLCVCKQPRGASCFLIVCVCVHMYMRVYVYVCEYVCVFCSWVCVPVDNLEELLTFKVEADHHESMHAMLR